MKKNLAYKTMATCWIFAILILMDSCVKREYEIRIENRTKYDLDSLVYRMGNHTESISLKAYESSPTITTSYTYTPLNLFAEGGLGLTVLKYSDADSDYSYNLGIFSPMHRFSTKEINKFTITESKERNPDGVVFGYDKE